MQLWVDPSMGIENELRMEGESRGKHEAPGLGRRAEDVEVRPRALRVDVIGSHWGDAAPVVDSSVEQHPEVIGEVGWRLKMHFWRQNETSEGDGVEVVIERAGRFGVHRRSILGKEVLHDDFLHMAISPVRSGDRLECFDPVVAVLPDANEDPSGEGDLQLTRPFECGQASLWGFVGRSTVTCEVAAKRLDHHPLRWRHCTKPREILAGECPGVCMGEKSTLLEDQAGHGDDVINGGGMAVIGQPFAGYRIAVLWGFAESEQRFVAASTGPGNSECPNLCRGEIGRFESRRWLGEGAVSAAVAAQHREGNEHLGRIGDPGAESGISDGARLRHE